MNKLDENTEDKTLTNIYLVCRYWWALREGIMVERSAEGEEEVTMRGRWGMGGGMGGP